MPQSLEVAFQHAAAMEVALRGFVSCALSRPAFVSAFRQAFAAYTEAVDSRPYSPLEAIADSGRRPDEQLMKFCSQALERLPRELLDRSTRQWITDHLVDDYGFSFLN